jgi:Predicted phosphatase/phosphohexomutase
VVADKKPAPDIYHWVLRQMNLPPQACLAVEDSLPGLRAATAAGIPTVITVNAYSADDDFAGALSVLSDLGEPGAPARRLGGRRWPGNASILPSCAFGSAQRWST